MAKKGNTNKQKALPGMEDRKLKDLNDAAEAYAEKRDARMELLREEVTLKNRVHDLMRSHKKTKYVYENLEIEIMPGEEKLRVKVHQENVAEGDQGDEG